jgi:hypothetical protein
LLFVLVSSGQALNHNSISTAWVATIAGLYYSSQLVFGIGSCKHFCLGWIWTSILFVLFKCLGSRNPSPFPVYC